jgi:hypothetical protein
MKASGEASGLGELLTVAAFGFDQLGVVAFAFGGPET